MYKRLIFRRRTDNEEVLETPSFLTSYEVIKGIVKGRSMEIVNAKGDRLFYSVAGSHAEAKRNMKQQLIELGVKFLDEVRRQQV